MSESKQKFVLAIFAIACIVLVACVWIVVSFAADVGLIGLLSVVGLILIGLLAVALGRNFFIAVKKEDGSEATVKVDDQPGA